jgi:hypothetical protein
MKFLLISLLCFAIGTVHADAFNVKVNTVIFSSSHQVKVYSKTSGKTCAVRKYKRLWCMNEYVKFGYVSDDGKYFVAVFGGGNLVPRDPPNNLILLTFYRNGNPIKEIKLSEIIQDTSRLMRTESHSYWGDPIGFTKQHTFEVKRFDGKVLSFDLGRARG